jgi:hypothetical protein
MLQLSNEGRALAHSYDSALMWLMISAFTLRRHQSHNHKKLDCWLPRDTHIPIHLRLQLRGEQPPLQECEAVEVPGGACL